MRSILFLLLFSLITFPGLTHAANRCDIWQEKPAKPHFEFNDSITKNKILKKIVKAFSFKKNLQAKEEKRVVGIINKVFAQDSIIFTLTNIKKLNSELSKKENQHFDTLLALINQLSKHMETIQSTIAANASASVTPADEQPAPETDIDNLVSKLVPILKDKADEDKANEELQQRLMTIRKLFLSPQGVTDTLKLNDSTYKKYTVTLRRKADLFGYNPFWMKNNYLDYNFKLLNTLAYYAYELDGKTGSYQSLNGWDTARVIGAAQKSGCKVMLVIHSNNAKGITEFLKNTASQRKLCSTVLPLLAKRQANGINILFEGLNSNERDQMVKFVRVLSKVLKEANPGYQLSITVPVLDEEMAYDIGELNPFVDKFIIDFSKKTGYGPIAPLKGGNISIESGVSRYLNKGIPGEKFIACMPYYGARWETAGQSFIEYIPYSKIKALPPAESHVVYDNTNATACINVLYDQGDTIEKIWFDDDKTLSKKYDFILQNNISGIGIWALGYDNNREELWNTLMDKLYATDTIHAEIIHVKHEAKTKRGFWAKVKHELHALRMLLADPCHCSRSEYKSDDYIGYVTLFILIVFVAAMLYYLYKIKTQSDDWIYKKTMLWVLIAIALIFLVSMFMLFFLRKDIPLIGLTDDNNTCHPIPFKEILFVIAIGFFCGFLVTRLLIFPLIRKDEHP